MHPFASSPQSAAQSGQSTLPDISRILLPEVLTSRKARIQDVDGMSALINEFASARIMLARGPLYLYQNIQDYRVVAANLDDKEIVLACGGLHILWEDLAEVRSVAVHPLLQHKGIGR
ncbi:MAG: GNAT family N-acetyltransferase, partial [Mailhella sp.]